VAGLSVDDQTPRYNDLGFRLTSTANITWGWKVTSGHCTYCSGGDADNLQAAGEIAQGGVAGYAGAPGLVDVADPVNFTGPPYYVYPDTLYTVSLYPGGLASACAPTNIKFRTPYDPTPQCVTDNTCSGDAPGDDGGDGDDGSGACSDDDNCCPTGFCGDCDENGICTVGAPEGPSEPVDDLETRHRKPLYNSLKLVQDRTSLPYPVLTR
jgi:hypothetical protein